MTLGYPKISVEGDAYRLSWPSYQIEAEVDRLSEHRDELSAEVTIHSTRQPNPGLLHSARLNLMSTQTRKSLVSALVERDPDVDWAGLVEQMCFAVRERYRNGDPALDMREYVPTAEGQWLLEPFVERGGATILFADGGTGKSMTALAIAASVATGRAVVGRLRGAACPVMYLDWETDPDTFHARLLAIANGADFVTSPEIHYRRQVASLSESAAVIRREIAKLGVGLVIIDSLGAARAGEPESAEMTIRLFNAARTLGVPWLGVDHVTKAVGNDSTRPFGSTYTHNLARLTWSMDKAQEEGENGVVVSLTNRKRNNGRLLSRLGYRIEFDVTEDERLEAVRFHNADLTQVPGLAEKLPIRTRMISLLRERGKLKVHEIAEELGVSADTVKKTITRNPTVFWKGPGPDGVQQIALLVREAA